MAERSIVICGLPESGKTTFLAALWHLITDRELETTLKFTSLLDGDHTHLNAIADKWRAAEPQERTDVKSRTLVSMSLSDTAGRLTRITFPDLSGETYRQMWEDRQCDQSMGKIIRNGSGLLLFINSDSVQRARSVVEEVTQTMALGLPLPKDEDEEEWDPKEAPTQVQLVDILQIMTSFPLCDCRGNLAVMLSAWDKVVAEQRTPIEFLQERLPFLHQYIESNFGKGNWRVYGLSAQGGDYECAFHAMWPPVPR